MPLSSDEVKQILDEELAQLSESDPPQFAVVVAHRKIGTRLIEEICPRVDTEARDTLHSINRMVANAGLFAHYNAIIELRIDLAPRALAAMMDFQDTCEQLAQRWDRLPDEPTKCNRFTREALTMMAASVGEELQEAFASYAKTGAMRVPSDRFRVFGMTAGPLMALAVGDSLALTLMDAIAEATGHLRLHARVWSQAKAVAERDDMPES